MVGGNSGFPFKRSKKLEGNYKDGKVHGMKTEWQENGYKMSETRYENGVKKD
jgi:antitoxin component YwqK of YwqJK toxin-antitoxin module